MFDWIAAKAGARTYANKNLLIHSFMHFSQRPLLKSTALFTDASNVLFLYQVYISSTIKFTMAPRWIYNKVIGVEKIIHLNIPCW